MTAEEEIKFANKFIEVMKDHLTFAPQVGAYVLHSEGRKAIIGFCEDFANHKLEAVKEEMEKLDSGYHDAKKVDNCEDCIVREAILIISKHIKS